MSRRRFRRNNGQDINLTPLLDVLFVILFIVMLSGRENENRLRAESVQETEVLQTQLEDAKEQISRLEREAGVSAAKVRDYSDRIGSYELYREQAVILTLHIEESAGFRELVILGGESVPGAVDGEEQVRIQIADDLREYTENRLRDAVAERVGNAQNRPVFIVFHYSADEIYTYEIRLIDRVLLSLQEEYKEVFYKTMRDGAAEERLPDSTEEAEDTDNLIDVDDDIMEEQP